MHRRRLIGVATPITGRGTIGGTVRLDLTCR
jgi:hypothetical protein